MMSSSSVLLPRLAGKYIAEHSKHVKISIEGVQQTAGKMLARLKSHPESMNVERWSTHELNPKTSQHFNSDYQMINWIFVSDLLNFSFWSDDESNKYTVIYKGKAWTGYWSLCAAMNRALDEGVSLCDPNYYHDVSMEQLKNIFRSDSNVAMPMMEERQHNLHEAGKVLCEKFDGSFGNVVEASNHSAQTLLKLIIENFPCFRDEAIYEGKTVGIYKRAQILIGDLWAGFQGRGVGVFNDIDTITMFADYRIPQALVWFDVLQYSEELMNKLMSDIMFESGDRQEVEIRGCSIWAVELIVEEMKKRMKADSTLPSTAYINSIILDHYLWDYRRDHNAATSHIPIHKIRCIYY